MSTFFFSIIGCFSEQKIFSERTTKEARERFYSEIISNTINKVIESDSPHLFEKELRGAIWAAQLIQYKSDKLENTLRNTYRHWDTIDESTKRSILEISFSLYPNSFVVEIESAITNTDSPKLFAMGIHYLFKNDPTKEFHKIINNYFPESDHPIIWMLRYDLDKEEDSLPPIKDLLEHDFGKPVIYSLQRKNRDYLGLTIVKDTEGNFIRNNEEEIFSIAHLARSVTNLPGYITNGNSPQGIYSIQGIGFSENVFIGPSPNIILTLPHEINLENYSHGDAAGKWDFSFYQNLLPESWKNYKPIQTAYYAGLAGRSEIIAHGSTINPEYYTGAPYYPLTPSLGCITAYESWSEADGSLIKSDQQKLVDAFQQIGKSNGYFVLIEIDDKDSNVTINEVKKLLK